MASNKFIIRDDTQSPRDADFILAAFDGSLPHLASKGSGQQWGARPFSERDGVRDRVESWIAASEASRRGEQGVEPGRLFVAEVELDPSEVTEEGVSVRTDPESGRRLLSVAAAGVRKDWWPTYFKQFDHLQKLVEGEDAAGGVMYLEVLISDFRTGSARKGAGAVLLHKVKEYAVAKGATKLYLDCFAGNDGNLVKFYEAQGFVSVADFVDEKNGGWPGRVLKMDLTS
ncbi:hypothetical protein LQW54_009239 [Pestalotiopsis sp. IQ-011]